MKKLIAIATAITCAILIACACAMPACADTMDRGEFYPLLTVVVSCEPTDAGEWLVTCEDERGNLWSFWEDEQPWDEGDLCNLLMWNMGGQLEDDEVVEVYYVEKFF